VLALCAALAPATAYAEPGVLLAVTEVDADAQARYWWTSSEAPEWTGTDRALMATLETIGLSAVDPSSDPAAPRISSVVYGHPHLTATNAINLASLFGAPRVIAGTVAYERLPAPPPLETSGARVDVDLHVFATSSSIEVLPLELEEVAYAETFEAARERALERVLERVEALLSHTRALAEARVGIPSQEPVLVVTGLREAGPLIALKRFLKQRDEIDDALERWAAEGVIAVELNPEVVDEPTVIMRAIDALLRHQFDGFVVREVSRDGNRVELMVQRTRRAPEGAGGSAGSGPGRARERLPRQSPR